jgi:molybdopterin biosynthesis enzyme
MMGYKDIWPMEFRVKLEKPIEWGRDRFEFVRGIFNPQSQTVMPFAENESHMLREFALSNCFILAEKMDAYKKGEEVSVHLI